MYTRAESSAVFHNQCLPLVKKLERPQLQLHRQLLQRFPQVTINSANDLDLCLVSVNVNHHAKYVGQRSFNLKVNVWTRR